MRLEPVLPKPSPERSLRVRPAPNSINEPTVASAANNRHPAMAAMTSSSDDTNPGFVLVGAAIFWSGRAPATIGVVQSEAPVPSATALTQSSRSCV